VAGARAVFALRTVAGCRYRLTVTPRGSLRCVLSLGNPGEEPLTRVDGGSPGHPVVHAWQAERDAVLELAVTGFSAETGNGRVMLQTLDAAGRPTGAHRRFLAVGGARASVGELLVGEANRWELVVEPGRAYEIEPTRGSAGRVRLTVLDGSGARLADSAAGGGAWVARPPVRFRVPEPPADPQGKAAPAPPVLEVRSLLGGGGTYGLRMRLLGPEEHVQGAEAQPPPDVERGPVEGQAQAFRAGPGDVAVLYVRRSPDRTQIVQVRRGDAWLQLDDMGLGGSARSQENALVVWFQPYYPGTYRFLPVPAPPPVPGRLLLYDRAALGSAPIHMGTGVDPRVRARLRASWRLVALGICMPGWDYLFVCVGGPDRGIAMRVCDDHGKPLHTRSAAAETISPGLGPSLRFRVREPGVYRLEARCGRPLVVRPLLRRASN
jgi:hypothetical protein